MADSTPVTRSGTGAPRPEAPPPAPVDPAAILRSRNFVVVLVFAAVVGLAVSMVGWAFLEAVHQIQVWVFTDLPGGLGLDPVPSWWPLPVCTLAGLPVAFAIARLPGEGGHVPANGLRMGGTETNMLPGIVLAALATIGLGLVLGPESPLIAIGTGVAVLIVKRAKRDAPPTLLLVLGAAGAFAAISVVFGSPIIAAIIIIEASGLAGSTLALLLIPGLIAAGIGSLVFIGMASWTGLSTSAYSLAPLPLAELGNPTMGEIGWTVLLGIAAAIFTVPCRKLGLWVAGRVPGREFAVVPFVGFLVAGVAFVFAQVTDQKANLVLFSGQDALDPLIANAGTFSVATLIVLVVAKGVAWGLSLGAFRGGPTFPAMFIGAAGGLAVSHLPGFPMSAAVPVAIGAMFVSFLRLPLSAIVIASLLCASAGTGVAPLVIVGVVVAYLVTLALEGRLGAAKADAAPAAAEPVR